VGLDILNPSYTLPKEGRLIDNQQVIKVGECNALSRNTVSGALAAQLLQLRQRARRLYMYIVLFVVWWLYIVNIRNSTKMHLRPESIVCAFH